MEKIKVDLKYLNIEQIKNDYEKYIEQMENVRNNNEYELLKAKADNLNSLMSAFLSTKDMVELYLSYKNEVYYLNVQITKLKKKIKRLS